MNIDEARAFYTTMVTIRAVESQLEERWPKIFQLPSRGEEGVACAVAAAMQQGEQLLTSGRSLGLALARGVPLAGVVAEVLGRTGGVCGGVAGRGHLSSPKHGFFGAHTVVGGNLSVACGVAFSEKFRTTGRAVVCVFGDGACGEGSFHEALNYAQLWSLPLLFVCNDNGYSVSVATECHFSASIVDVAASFMPSVSLSGDDIYDSASELASELDLVRKQVAPRFVVFRSYRLGKHSNHSKQIVSKPELMELERKRCPVQNMLRHFPTLKDEEDSILQSVSVGVERAFASAEAQQTPNLGELFTRWAE